MIDSNTYSCFPETVAIPMAAVFPYKNPTCDSHELQAGRQKKKVKVYGFLGVSGCCLLRPKTSLIISFMSLLTCMKLV